MKRAPRLLVVVVTGALLAAGCGSLLPEPESPGSQFDFGPLPESAAMEAFVTVRPVAAPSWLGGTRIPYRRLHRQPEAVSHYAHNVWVAPPAELLFQRLQHMLAGAPTTGSEWTLQVEMLEFEQAFAAPNDAEVRITLHATLRERSGSAGVLRHQISKRRSVTPDVQGAIRGLPEVADAALIELLRWVDGVTGP